ncbi:TonB-dependent receptor [Hyphococcus sp.]|uniref:TonB-dependent receptor n=1 Tax=Hyphococcus sp. TaxID=2038636 RepID=UPI003CCC44EE
MLKPNSSGCGTRGFGLAGGASSIAITLAAAGGVTMSAHAQDEPVAGIDTIVVSARKREENLQETPVAITAFSSGDLAKRSVVTLDGIGDYTPNLVFDKGTGGTGGSTSTQIYIRGIGQADFLFTTEPGVGIYVDGVYHPRSIGSIMDLVDIERVEVLKGPQGTLFGKNSVGGAINVVSRRPGNEFSGGIEAVYGRFDRVDVRANLNVPLVEDKLAASLAFSSHDIDGYVKRPLAGDELGGINSKGVRGQVLWTPTENFDLLLSSDYTRHRDDAIANTLIDVDQTGSLIALWNGLVAPAQMVFYDDSYISEDPFVSNGTGPNFSDLDLWGVSGVATLRAGDLTFKSVTAYRNQDAFFGHDSDHSPLTYFEQTVDDNQKQFSQELQINGSHFDGRFDWVLGALYFHEEGLSTYRIIFAPGLYDALEMLPAGIIDGLGGMGNPVHPLLDFDGAVSAGIDNDSYAVFAHTNFAVTDRLSVSGGIRYTYDEKGFDSILERFSAGVVTHDVSIEDDWSAWTPKISLDYDLTDNIMVYASAARGFKSGGFNGRPTNAFVAMQPFDPEYVWTYETGFKSEFANRRFILNGAMFYSDYTNMQLLAVSIDNFGGIVALVENAGAAEIKGFELEMNAVPARNLRLDAGIGFLDAEYSELDPSVASISLDSELVKTPKWSLNFGGEYTAALGGALEATFRADYSYRTRTQHVADNNPLLTQDAYGLLSLRLSLAPVDGPWEVSVFGTNLTDERYISNGLSQFDTLGTTDVTFGRPREWGVMAKWSF